MIVSQSLEMTNPDGRGIGRWRLVEMSDEDNFGEPLCDCGGRAWEHPTTAGHESPEAARACPIAAAKVLARTGVAPPAPIPDLARVAFEAYGASTGGKTWDGKAIPPFDEVRVRTPHVAAAWEAAVAAVLAARGAR